MPAIRNQLFEPADAPKDEARYLAAYPDLLNLCTAAKAGDHAAFQAIYEIGLGVSMSYMKAVGAHTDFRQSVRTRNVVPGPIFAARDLTDQFLTFLWDTVGFGRELQFRTAPAKGGPKRFKAQAAPSFVAYELFWLISDYRLNVAPTEVEATRKGLKAEMRLKASEQPLTEEARTLLLEQYFLLIELALLPDLKGTNYLKWAEVGARAMVDLTLPNLNLPPIPPEWQTKASKRKGKVGALRDIVRKELESGFKALTPS